MSLKNKFGLVQIPLLVGLLLMAVAVPVATKLVQQNQDSRNLAYDADCAPKETQCSGTDKYQICGARGQWGLAIKCPSGSTCKNGSCVSSCTPDSSCAANTCKGKTCTDRCGNTWQGSENCSEEPVKKCYCVGSCSFDMQCNMATNGPTLCEDKYCGPKPTPAKCDGKPEGTTECNSNGNSFRKCNSSGSWEDHSCATGWECISGNKVCSPKPSITPVPSPVNPNGRENGDFCWLNRDCKSGKCGGTIIKKCIEADGCQHFGNQIKNGETKCFISTIGSLRADVVKCKDGVSEYLQSCTGPLTKCNPNGLGCTNEIADTVEKLKTTVNNIKCDSGPDAYTYSCKQVCESYPNAVKLVGGCDFFCNETKSLACNCPLDLMKDGETKCIFNPLLSVAVVKKCKGGDSTIFHTCGGYGARCNTTTTCYSPTDNFIKQIKYGIGQLKCDYGKDRFKSDCNAICDTYLGKDECNKLCSTSADVACDCQFLNVRIKDGETQCLESAVGDLTATVVECSRGESILREFCPGVAKCVTGQNKCTTNVKMTIEMMQDALVGLGCKAGREIFVQSCLTICNPNSSLVGAPGCNIFCNGMAGGICASLPTVTPIEVRETDCTKGNSFCSDGYYYQCNDKKDGYNKTRCDSGKCYGGQCQETEECQCAYDTYIGKTCIDKLGNTCPGVKPVIMPTCAKENEIAVPGKPCCDGLMPDSNKKCFKPGNECGSGRSCPSNNTHCVNGYCVVDQSSCAMENQYTTVGKGCCDGLIKEPACGNAASCKCVRSGTITPSTNPMNTPTPTSGSGDSCKEVLTGNLLQCCSPKDSDGTSKDALCNSQGKQVACGGKNYCCSSNGGNWTTDMSACGGSGTCKSCPTDFGCYALYKNNVQSEGVDEYKWFVPGYVMNDFVKVEDKQCTDHGVKKPTYLGKSKGDANCDGVINNYDLSTWRSEYITSGGNDLKRSNWEADFNCDQVVDIYDRSTWRDSYRLYVGN